MRTLVRVRSVEVLDGYTVRIEFTSGERRDVDLEAYLRDPAVFRALRVDPQLGTIVWENGADIDPDVLYHGLRPAWMEPEHKLTDGSAVA